MDLLLLNFTSLDHITMSDSERRIVQTFGRKKNAVAVATAVPGKGTIRVNGKALALVEPAPLRLKVYEPILLLGAERFQDLLIRVRVKGGGASNQVYAIRQAICRAIIAWYQKYEDEQSKLELKELLLQYDRHLVIADDRRSEPKKYGGPGARARYQKSYR